MGQVVTLGLRCVFFFFFAGGGGGTCWVPKGEPMNFFLGFLALLKPGRQNERSSRAFPPPPARKIGKGEGLKARIFAEGPTCFGSLESLRCFLSPKPTFTRLYVQRGR